MSYNKHKLYSVHSTPPTICQQFTIVPNYPLTLLHTCTRTLSVSLTPSLSHHSSVSGVSISHSRLSRTSGGWQQTPNWWVKGQSWSLTQQMAETNGAANKTRPETFPSRSSPSLKTGPWETGRGSSRVTGRALYNVRLRYLKRRDESSIVDEEIATQWRLTTEENRARCRWRLKQTYRTRLVSSRR